MKTVRMEGVTAWTSMTGVMRGQVDHWMTNLSGNTLASCRWVWTQASKVWVLGVLSPALLCCV